MDPMIKALEAIFPADRLRTKPADRYAYATDASFYLLVPQAVVFPENLQEVKQLFELAARYRTSVTFRAAGTSLSGQSVTEGILADISRHWDRCQVLDNGSMVSVQPGVIGHTVNHYLKKYGRKIGPDPASIQSAMMGGILSNNSSGMCCGVVHNSYHTLAQIEFLLPNGMQFNTALPGDYARLEKECPQLNTGMLALKQQILSNTALVQKVRSKYRLKNTVGYSLNAFLDYEHPLDILAHLLIGGEGTLGFIASAVLHTIPDQPFKATGLLCFASSREACEAITALKASGAAALEFMDNAALRAIEHLPQAPAFLQQLPARSTCILCEYQAPTQESLAEQEATALHTIQHLPLIYNTGLTRDAKQQAIYWKLRKGLYPSVAAVRAAGTSVMLEDVAVPVDMLGDAVESLQQLFTRHGYHDAIVFGHAKEGNLHFLVSQPVNTPEEIALFEKFNDELAALVVHQYNGSLKAEHGTGRQIAPYIAMEWGQEAYEIMKALKQLVDEKNILNTGVLINDDPHCHVQHLKSLPVVEEEVDKCVECGYCEHRCPSRAFTLTPRQRISLRRSMARLKQAGDLTTYKSILKDYQFNAMDTCAVDGLCATDCPVSINTGELIKRLRKENHSPGANRMALLVAKHFAAVEWVIKTALRSGHLLNKLAGKKFMYRFTSLVRKLAPGFPVWPQQLSKPPSLSVTKDPEATLIYFVTCINRLMGSDNHFHETPMDVLSRLTHRAGIRLQIVAGEGICCGQIFSSKGFVGAQQAMVNKTIASLWEWTRAGKMPVMTDITSCTFSLHQCRHLLTPDNQARFDQLTILDSIQVAHDYLLPRLTVVEAKDKVVFHPVCSVHKMDLFEKLQAIGKFAAKELIVPFHAGCCGMAGDRGFYYPELIRSATHRETTEAALSSCDGHYSTAKTCEMALSEFSQQQYRSIFYLLDEVTTPTTVRVVSKQPTNSAFILNEYHV